MVRGARKLHGMVNSPPNPRKITTNRFSRPAQQIRGNFSIFPVDNGRKQQKNSLQSPQPKRNRKFLATVAGFDTVLLHCSDEEPMNPCATARTFEIHRSGSFSCVPATPKPQKLPRRSFRLNFLIFGNVATVKLANFLSASSLPHCGFELNGEQILLG